MPIYRDIPYVGPPRHYGRERYPKLGITVHCTANTASAEAEASYARRRADSVSSHYYVDHDSIVQSLDTGLRAFHAGSTWPNRHGIAYEFTGQNGWSRAKWLSSVDWDAAARQIARDCEQWGIPARWVTVAQLKNHEGGLHTHDDCRRAFGGTTHTDPGSNFPKDHLLARVQAALGSTITPEGDDLDMAAADRIISEIYTRYLLLRYGVANAADAGDPAKRQAPCLQSLHERQVEHGAVLAAVVERVGLSAEDLAAITTAAREGARLGVSDEADDAVAAALRAGADAVQQT